MKATSIAQQPSGNTTCNLTLTIILHRPYPNITLILTPWSPLLNFAHLCRSYPFPGSIVFISPAFSVLCEIWIGLVFSQIAPHSVHPPQSGPSSRHLFPPTFIVVTSFASFLSYLLITRRYQDRRLWVTYFVIGLSIASLLNFSFLILSFLFCPGSTLEFVYRL